MASRRDLPVAEIARRYQQGASLRTLAVSYGVAVGTIQGRLREMGVLRRRRGAPRRDLDGDALAGLHRRYGSTRRTAAALQVSRSTVQRRLQERVS